MRLCTSPSVAVEVVLVVQRPRRVAPAHPVRRRGEVAADAALVAERPHDHARVVLVALDGARDPVEVGVAPARVVARVAAPADLLEAVRLEVALGDHVEAVLVAELEEARVRRVVARAHRVDVVRLHQLDVAAHRGLGHRAPAVGVPLVAVDAAQQHAAAVDAQLAVLDRHGAEADPQRHRLARRAQLAVVEPRQLRAPWLDRPGGDGLPRRASTPSSGTTTRAGTSAVDAQRAVGVRVHEHVAGAAGRAREQLDAPEQPRQPPHVLVLEVAARRPLRDAAPRARSRRRAQQRARPRTRARAGCRTPPPARSRSTTPAGASPRRRSAAPRRPRGQPGGSAKRRRYSPVGFSSGTHGGSTGNG